MKASTERDYRRRIAKVIETILLDPAAGHTVESLAAVANFSPYHFHRLFRDITGESVAAAVQRIRFAQAAYKLAEGEDSVTGIAIDHGYDSPQAFARAFRGLAGATPTEYQASQREIEAVTLTQQKPMTALCLRHEGPAAAIPHSYRALLDWAGRDVPRIGLVSLHADGMTYHAGVLSEDLPPSAPVERREIPGGTYALYRLHGSYALIAPTLQSLTQRWLPKSGYALDDRPIIELYRTDYSHPSPELVTDLLIPVH